MSLRIVVDMNLSVEWIPLLEQAGWPAVHWSAVGDPRAEDETIMAWALANGHVVFTHDLDFGTTLALTHAEGPSVIQVRGQRVLPEHIVQWAVTVGMQKLQVAISFRPSLLAALVLAAMTAASRQAVSARGVAAE